MSNENQNLSTLPSGADRPVRRSRTAVRLAVAACIMLLAGGLVVLAGSQRDTGDVALEAGTHPTTSGPSPTPSSTASSPARASTLSATTSADERGWSGGLLADVRTTSLRPLRSLTTGDAIVPTGPDAWRSWDPSYSMEGDDAASRFIEAEVSVIEAQPDGSIGRRIELTLTPFPVCGPASPGCALSDTAVTINDVEWQSFVESDGVRASIGGLWVDVHARHFEFDGPMIEDPVIVEYLERLRSGTFDDLMGIGGACWDCSQPMLTERELEPMSLREIDGEGLRGLDALSSGDVMIPTAPASWFFDRSIVVDFTDARPSQLFTVGADKAGSQMLEVYVVPNCGDGVEACEVTAMNGYTIRPPEGDLIDIDGNTWGTWSASAVIGDSIVAIANTWYESDIPLFEDPAIIEFIEGLRVASLAELPDQIQLSDRNGTPVDHVTGNPPEKMAVASAIVRGTTLVLNAAVAGDEVCLTLDRADSGETVWPSGCRNRANFDRNSLIGVAELASGPMFNTGQVGDELEYLLVGYVDAPTSVVVRATSETVSVEGRSAEPNDLVDGVFVLMSVNELDEVIDFDSCFHGSMIQLKVTES